MNVTAAGHLGFTGLVHEAADGSVTWFRSVTLLSDAQATTLAGQAGFTYPAGGKAFVEMSIFRASGGAFVGETATISPGSGTGPVYADTTGTPTPALTGVTSNGYLYFGGLTPGKIEITAGGAACTPAPLTVDAWTDTKASSIAGETAADSMTQMTLICQ
jgi:hypothetical protein